MVILSVIILSKASQTAYGKQRVAFPGWGNFGAIRRESFEFVDSIDQLSAIYGDVRHYSAIYRAYDLALNQLVTGSSPVWVTWTVTRPNSTNHS